MSETVIRLTPDKKKEISKDMAFISSFIGIMVALAQHVEMGDVAGCDIWTLAEEAQDRACYVRDQLGI